MNRPILKLDEGTVNRIAAGEVVQRPSAAVKEMMENSLDAGATIISVTIKNGGLQLMQIQDNGHGIRRDDLGLVCERFTTSKLRNFDDLKTIGTFGFRGEALASITHVAHVTITTRTADSKCAYKARYSDGTLVPLKSGGRPDPQPCAGLVGTTITVEDLFYNMTTRKLAFKNTSEQYQRVVDIVGKYSIHYGDRKIAFTCKKHGQNVADIHTPQTSSIKENIKLVYGSEIFKELIDFAFTITDIDNIVNAGENVTNIRALRDVEREGASTTNLEESKGNSAEIPETGLSIMVKGYVTNANYSSKKGVGIFFINDRLIDCPAIKRVIDGIYSELLPRHNHPFVYLDIRMPAAHVDVNVHPTKKEVHFLHETELLETLHMELRATLSSANESRTFYTQTQIPSTFTPKVDHSLECQDRDSTSVIAGDGADANGAKSSSKESRDAYSDEKSQLGRKRQVASLSSMGSAPNKMIRVDPKLRKIDTVFSRVHTVSSASVPANKTSDKKSLAESSMISQTGAEGYSNAMTLLLCGECGTENSMEKMVAALSQSPSKRRSDGHFPANCECCGSANLVAQTPSETCITNKTNKNSAPIKGGRGRSWDPKMAHFEETSVGYDSIRALLDRFQKGASDSSNLDIARRFSFVGVLDNRYTAVQLETMLLLLNHGRICYHLFYQLCLRRFACAPKMVLSEPVPILTFIRAALDLPEAQWNAEVDRDKDEIASTAVQILVDNAEMLEEYFSIGIFITGNNPGRESNREKATLKTEESTLVHLPVLLDGYMPLTAALPMFLLRLATDTSWDNELDCFETICKAIASFYSILDDSDCKVEDASSSGSAYVPGLKPAQERVALLENLFFPAIKSLLSTPNEVLSDDAVIQVASLDQLYKVFERC